MSGTDSSKTIRSVVRALSVLNTIGSDIKGISAISKELELSKGTVFDLIKTLEHMGYVIQDQQDERYRLGPALLKLAMGRYSRLDIIELAAPYLQILSDDIGEITHLGKREGLSATYLYRANSRKVSHMLNLNSRVGALSPLHCTSLGKVLLAYMDEAEIMGFLKRDLEKFTPETIVDKAKLLETCEQIRKKGYAVNLGEFEEGVSSVAVPVRDIHGTVIAAVNVALPSVRMPRSKIPYFYQKLKATAQQIEKELGA